MKRLYLDIETVPGQSPWIRESFAEKYLAGAKAAAEAKLAEIDQLRPPLNLKDTAKIDAWHADTKPVKVAALRAEAEALVAAGEIKADEDWKRTSFDGALGQIVVIGYAFDDAKPVCHFEKDPKKCLTLEAEARVIRAFFKDLEQVPIASAHELVVVGHNVVDFDLRFLWQRCVVHGITPPHWMPWDSKPWGDRVFDTMVRWSGQKGRISQDKLCRVLGIEAKGTELLGDEIDGSKVWDFVKAGRIADVATYCGGDVHRAREIRKRLVFQEGA